MPDAPEPMTADDAVKAGAWLLGLIASAEHSNDGEDGASYALPAIDSLLTISHDGQHWLAEVLSVACWHLGATIAREHGDPEPKASHAAMLQHVIEHLGSVVTA